ncbi:MAG: hypothetical protein A3D39_00190 [Candidatus Buchananbacteria bacterium RIFCSPHIGHO2_02_FULL_39_17]|uniref:Uncharacterized protein n=1 Tax=Candidatus Buchananbacteria bacterium RIFCSPLOWO2_01_FULL_40_23b TaxID=1797544 RepID=A0A1G1YTW7_9BACT|nr:MAG: hypothetical protein A3D39_00190 [Candidatus Buchananbacteria bacterium RIFCSPHIGHO2_02_FULL_39_17]OGY55802.1 MAG: hypothetical protein A2912_01100 [Candidatus Buchananbacteria bacterium RIFCSPLOWO2_01_FULL_40_23b]
MTLTIDPTIYSFKFKKEEPLYTFSSDLNILSVNAKMYDGTDFFMKSNGSRFLNLTKLSGKAYSLNWDTTKTLSEFYPATIALYERLCQDPKLVSEKERKMFDKVLCCTVGKDTSEYSLEEYIHYSPPIAAFIQSDFAGGSGILKVPTIYCDIGFDNFPGLKRAAILSGQDLSTHIPSFIRATSLFSLGREDEQVLEAMVSYFLNEKIFKKTKQ